MSSVLKKAARVAVAVAAVLPFLTTSASPLAAASLSRASLPLSFEHNEGQAASPVKYISRGASGLLLLSPDEITLRAPGQPDRLRFKLRGAAATSIAGTGERSGAVNYLHGNDSSKWLTNIPTYTQVTYKNIYPQIDLIVYGNHGQFESDFVVARGADPSAITLQLDGKLQLSPDGALHIQSAGGAFQLHTPFVYQVAANGDRQVVACRYTIDGNKVGFALGRYDRSKSLTIDPVISYSTYLGGAGVDAILSIRTDSVGYVYVAGQTTSTNFPTSTSTTPYQAKEKGPSDCFVSKFDPTGEHLIYSTYLGGSKDDKCTAVAINSAGEAFVGGTTYSSDFPTVHAVQTSLKTGAGGSTNGFVAALDCHGSTLIFSTYLGGGGEFLNDLALDSSSNVYVVGVTDSGSFPVTRGAYQTTCGGSTGSGCPAATGGAAPFATDAFLTKFSQDGCLVFSTYLGGSNFDAANGVAVDKSGSAYVTGQADSINFPTKTPYQAKNAGFDNAFVTKFSPSGASLVYSTYLGGNTIDSGNSIAVDASGNAYITGSTMSTNFPVLNAFQTSYASTAGAYGSNAFVSKLNPAGTALLYSSYAGGSNYDHPFHITVDTAGNAYVAGDTSSPTFPTKSAIQPTIGGPLNAFLFSVASTGALNYSTFLGGSAGDYGYGVYADPVYSCLWLAGATYSANFPVTAATAYQPTLKGSANGFITRITP